MSDWDEFNKQLLEALRRFVQGDAEPVKRLWSHAVSTAKCVSPLVAR